MGFVELYIEISKRRNPNKWLGDKRKCSKCGIYKQLDEYRSYTRGNGRFKIDASCKKCASIRDKQYNKTKRDIGKLRNAQRAYYEKKRDLLKENGWSSSVTIFKCSLCECFVVKRMSNVKHHTCDSCLRKQKYKNFIKSSCPDCGSKKVRKHKTYCDDCASKRRSNNRRIYKANGNRTGTHRQRARKYCVKYQPGITKKKLFNIHNGLCAVCGIRTQVNDYLKPNAAEIDHIIPMSKGGPHTWNNVQLLCRSCNILKADKVDGQLVLNI